MDTQAAPSLRAPEEVSLIETRYSERYADLESAGGSRQESFRFLAGPLPADDLTHSLYPYPARLIRHVPRFLLRSQGFVGIAPPVVIDPFCGSGTVLVEAQAAGLDAVGFDTNPMAALVARVKTTPLDKASFVDEGQMLLARAKRARTRVSVGKRIAAWHSGPALSALGRLAGQIALLDEGPPKRALQVAFALTVRSCSTMDSRIPVPVVAKDGRGRSLGTQTVWETFLAALDRTALLTSRIRNGVGSVSVFNADAREAMSYSVVHERHAVLMTSPPYGAAQKYGRATAIEASWLGLISQSGPAEIEGRTIGREHILAADRMPDVSSLASDTELVAALEQIRLRSSARADIYAHYFLDMQKTVQALSSQLPTLSRVALIAGTNVVAGSTINTHEYLAQMFERSGFERRFVIEDEIRGRTLMTSRHRGNAPATSEFIYVMERAVNG